MEGTAGTAVVNLEAVHEGQKVMGVRPGLSTTGLLALPVVTWGISEKTLQFI